MPGRCLYYVFMCDLYTHVLISVNSLAGEKPKEKNKHYYYFHIIQAQTQFIDELKNKIGVLLKYENIVFVSFAQIVKTI